MPYGAREFALSQWPDDAQSWKENRASRSGDSGEGAIADQILLVTGLERENVDSTSEEAFHFLSSRSEHVVSSIRALSEVDHDVGNLVTGIVSPPPEDQVARADSFATTGTLRKWGTSGVSQKFLRFFHCLSFAPTEEGFSCLNSLICRHTLGALFIFKCSAIHSCETVVS